MAPCHHFSKDQYLITEPETWFHAIIFLMTSTELELRFQMPTLKSASPGGVNTQRITICTNFQVSACTSLHQSVQLFDYISYIILRNFVSLCSHYEDTKKIFKYLKCVSNLLLRHITRNQNETTTSCLSGSSMSSVTGVFAMILWSLVQCWGRFFLPLNILCS